MLRLILVVTAAALIAGGIVSVPALSANVEPSATVRKGDRLDLLARGAHYRPRAWPYDQADLQDGGQPIRLVTTDNF